MNVLVWLSYIIIIIAKREILVVIHSAYIANFDLHLYMCLHRQQKAHVTNKDTCITGTVQC